MQQEIYFYKVYNNDAFKWCLLCLRTETNCGRFHSFFGSSTDTRQKLLVPTLASGTWYWSAVSADGFKAAGFQNVVYEL